MNILISLLSMILLLSTQLSHAQSSCFFDHQLLTVSEDEFKALQTFFKNQKNLSIINAEFKPVPQDYKFFLNFKNGSYIEIWNSSLFSEFGNQDGFRTTDAFYFFNLIAPIYTYHFNIKPSQFGPLATIGEKGSGGTPDGGMFYVHTYGHQAVVSKKLGITDVVKNVRADAIPALQWNYNLCHIENVFSPTDSQLKIKDINGVSIVVNIDKNLHGKVSKISINTDHSMQGSLSIFKNKSSEIRLETSNNSADLIFTTP